MALLLLSPLLAAAGTAFGAARSVAYRTRVVFGARVHVVTVDLNDPRVKVTVGTAPGFPHGHDSFSSMVYRAQPSAAVTGTYFSNSSLRPVGDIVIDGQYRHFGGLGTAIALTPYNTVEFRTVPYGRRQDWGEFETVLGAGPRLLRSGEVMLAPRNEGFRDPHVLGRARRTAAGLTSRNKLLLAATRKPVSLYEWAKIMRALGCIEAVNLDGGGSTALYFDGDFIVRPQRKLVNLLMVYEDVPLLARHLTRMSPEQRRRQRAWLQAKAHEHFAAAQRLARRGEAYRAANHNAIAVQLAPGNASYAIALGRSLMAIGRLGASARSYATAGQILVAKKKYAEAIPPLGASVRLRPEQVPTRVNLAIAYQGAGRHAAAARQVLEARTLYARLARFDSRAARTSLPLSWTDTCTLPGDPAQEALLERILMIYGDRDPARAVRAAWCQPLSGEARTMPDDAGPRIEAWPTPPPRPTYGFAFAEHTASWDELTQWRLLGLLTGEPPYVHVTTDFLAMLERLRREAFPDDDIA